MGCKFRGFPGERRSSLPAWKAEFWRVKIEQRQDLLKADYSADSEGSRRSSLDGPRRERGQEARYETQSTLHERTHVLVLLPKHRHSPSSTFLAFLPAPV